MRGVWFLCVVAAVVACSSDEIATKGLAEGCLINSDCNSPLVCAFRKCHQACTSSRDCEPGQRCMASDRPFHVCQLADERLCSFNSDCPMGQVCGVDRQCRDQCAADRDCLNEQSCVASTCADNRELVDGGILVAAMPEAGPPASGIPCLYTSECPNPLVCRNKICSSECLTAIDCNAGEDCFNNRCIAGSGTLVGPEGGVVTVSAGKVKLTIPAGALRTPASILILPLEAWPAGALGQAYQILPSGLQFDPPATLTFAYGAEIGNLAPVEVKIATAVGSKWTPLVTMVDTAKKELSASLAHLSTYGLVGPSIVVDAGNGGAGGGGAGGGPVSGADAAAPIDASMSDGGSLGCQVICTNIDGCNCHTVGLCGGHNYSCSGAGSCTCFTDTTGGPTILDFACAKEVLTNTAGRGCGFPFVALPPG